MSAFGNILKKEIRELLTPATILPIVFVALIFGTMGNAISGIEETISEPPTIGLINEDNNTLGVIATNALTANAKIVFNSTTAAEKEQALQTLKQKNGVAVILIPDNFTTNIYNNTPGIIQVYWIMEGAGVFDAISSSALEGVLSRVTWEISHELVDDNTTVNATIALAPTLRSQTTYFKDREFIGLSPNNLAGILNQQSLIIPIIMMMIIIMAGSLVITSMAFEKENKTLETLLTLPVKRYTIVTGKIAASAIIGLLLSVVYMIGLGSYFQSFQMGGAIPLTSYDLSLTVTDFLLIGISLFITLVAALSLAMLLGTLAKNYKSAQTLTFPLVLLALVPMFLTMFMDFDTMPLAIRGLVFAIPFSHPMLAPKALLFNDYVLVFGGIVYVSIFAFITISLVVWIFKTDKLLTGTTRFKLGQRWKRKTR
jgi:ABC-2 type transport system permease protein